MTSSIAKRVFLFLQGPPGPFYWLLACRMRELGHVVHRINLSGGDKLDWPEAATDFRGKFGEWSSFFDHFVLDRGITDVLLFGDCRPYHVSAHRLAKSRGLRIHVMEEGYIRPHWMTLEPDGVNGNSTLPREADWFVQQARLSAPIAPVRPITASFKRRMKDSLHYYYRTVVGRVTFPFYRSHRPGSLILEGVGWLLRLSTKSLREKRAAQVLHGMENEQFFVFPLQLSSDYQIRTHSAFSDMASAAAYVIESFAFHAPRHTHLVLKAHPLDASFFNWSRFVQKTARRFRVSERVHFIDGGDLEQISDDSLGMVCVNSTSATLALEVGTPVCALGDAIYDMEGITHQGHIDTFWRAPTPPDQSVYNAFCRVLRDRCLVHGGIASESAVSLLVDSVMERLVSPQHNVVAPPALKIVAR